MSRRSQYIGSRGSGLPCELVAPVPASYELKRSVRRGPTVIASSVFQPPPGNHGPPDIIHKVCTSIGAAAATLAFRYHDRGGHVGTARIAKRSTGTTRERRSAVASTMAAPGRVVGLTRHIQ